jgi:FkbM family methyltransferase
MDRETNYGNASSQRIDSYPLEGITGSRFTYVPVALWKSRGKIHFFPPKEGSRDPSYSINAISSFYKRETIPTEVETETIKGLIEIYKIPEIHLLKLDIEGAALEVLKQMFKDLILPDQILLEIDEMHFPSLKSNFRTRKLLAQLKINGYLCIKQDNCDFTFIQKKFISK